VEPAHPARVAVEDLKNKKGSAATMDEGETHISTTEARAGATPHVTRYVLTIGLGLVVVLFALILLVWR
jgi:hypothetical protein